MGYDNYMQVSFNSDEINMILDWTERCQQLANDIETGRSELGRLSRADIRSSASEIQGRLDSIFDLLQLRKDRSIVIHSTEEKE